MNPKILLLESIISSYRIPIYNIIAEHVDLTIAYTIKNENPENCRFSTINLQYRKIAGLIFITNGFGNLCEKYDVVIFLSDLHYLSYCILPFIRRRYKVIPWTIGIRASYTKRYDINRRKDLIDRIYGAVLKKSDAIIFYMKDPIKFWGSSIDKNKVFIAHNTVEVVPNEQDNDQFKNSILFVGTLYKEKKIYELIEAFIEAKKKCNVKNFLKLDIIGNGEEYENIKALILEQKLSNCIFLHGAIYDEEELANYFAQSLLCISPDQAGLSVLKSMGYGVPYVTRTDAITGGERLNIINQENGLLYKTQGELVSIIEDAFMEPSKYLIMGRNAKEYYLSKATPQHMAQGVLDAIKYVLDKH